MDVFKEEKTSLNWHNDGKFSAVIVNGQITELHFCEPGGEKAQCLTSVNYKYLQDVHAALGDLFAHIEREAEKKGHAYALEEKAA